MDKAICGVCGRRRPRKSCHVVILTDKERQELEQQGVKPQDEYIYCMPCWRALTNPLTGPNFGKGLIQQRLAHSGVGNAEAIATKFHAKLVERIQRPKPS